MVAPLQGPQRVPSVALLAAVSLGTACTPPDTQDSIGPLREQRGDTTVVRGQGGGVLGDAFLGSLEVPEGLQLQPQPVFDASGLIGLELDDAGVPRLVRYRRGSGGTRSGPAPGVRTSSRRY